VVRPAFELEYVDDVAVLRLLGEHDLANVHEIRERLGLLADGGFPVVVDVSETEFMDVAVVRALLDGGETLRARGRALVVYNGTPCLVQRLLEVAGSGLDCVGDRQSAIRRAGQRSRTES
jgi:anti-anti-sigma factor